MKKWLILGVIVLCVGMGGYYVMKGDGSSGSAAIVQAQASELDTVAPAAGTEKDLWGKRCDKPKAKGAAAYCEVFQRLSVTKTKQRFMEFAVGYPAGKEKPAGGVMILPLGVLLESGATLQIDDKPVKQVPVRTCLPAGCIVKLEMDQSYLADMGDGKVLHVKFAGADGKVMAVDLQLQGFKETLAGL